MVYESLVRRLRGLGPVDRDRLHQRVGQRVGIDPLASATVAGSAALRMLSVAESLLTAIIRAVSSGAAAAT